MRRRSMLFVLGLVFFAASLAFAGGSQEGGSQKAAAQQNVSIQFAISPREIGKVIPGFINEPEHQGRLAPGSRRAERSAHPLRHRPCVEVAAAGCDRG